MTSRPTEKRTLRKCEPSLESLSTRIAPAGFHAGSLFVAGMGGHFDVGGGTGGKHHGGNGSDAPQFLVRTHDKTGLANYIIRGGKGYHWQFGSNHHAQPFLNLVVSNVSPGTTTDQVANSFPSNPATDSTPSVTATNLTVSNVTTPTLLVPPRPLINPPAPTPTLVVVPRPLINPPAPTGLPPTVDQSLATLYQEYELWAKSPDQGAFTPTSTNGLTIVGNNVGIEIYGHNENDFGDLIADAEGMGMQVNPQGTAGEIVEAMLPISQLLAVAELFQGDSILPAPVYITH